MDKRLLNRLQVLMEAKRDYDNATRLRTTARTTAEHNDAVSAQAKAFGRQQVAIAMLGACVGDQLEREEANLIGQELAEVKQ